MTERWLILPSPFLGPAAYEALAETLAAQSGSAAVATLPAAPFEPDDVLAGFIEQAARSGATVLVPHSNAGLYAPTVAAASGVVVATIYLDAALPGRGARRTPLAPAAFADTVEALAAPDGLLPPWTRWWDAAEIQPLFPSASWFERVDRSAPRLPAAYVRSSLPVPDGWETRPSGYLAFGDTYAAELAFARSAGWAAARLVGHHLSLLTEPVSVARQVRHLREECATSGLQ